MRKLIIFFITIFIVVTSCDKFPDEITINRSGYLEISVVDDQQNSYESVEIEIYGDYPYNKYEEGLTNSKGEYFSSTLLEGFYDCVAKIKKDKVVYIEKKAAQVIAKETRSVTLNPLDNVGNVTFLLKDYWTAQGRSATVLLLDNEDNWYHADQEKIMELAWFNKKAGDNGVIEFKDIPADTYYRIYYLGENFMYAGNAFMLKKGDDKYITEYI